MSTLRWGAATHPGMVRPDNEDAYVTEGPVFAVADGMGGHLAGEVASEMAVAALRRRLVEHAAPNDVGAIVSAVRTANLEIHEAASRSAERRGMGTTLTALAVLNGRSDGDERLALVNVGDSRAYVLRGGRLHQLSVDHSYVQELISSGQLDPADARTHPHRNIVTRALGIDRNVHVDAWTLPLVTGDRFLLCSDGLVDEVVDEAIAELLQAIDDPQQAAEQLVATANRHGGRDNTTVVVLDIVEGGPSPDPELDILLEPQWADGEGEVDHWADEVVDEVTHQSSVVVRHPGAPRDVTGPLARPAATNAATGAAPAEPAPTATRAAAQVVPNTSTAVTAGPAGAVTDSTPGSSSPREPAARRRRLTFPMIIFLTAVAGVFVAALVITAAWARSGYFLGFDGDTVTVYKGRADAVLWFDPTVAARLPQTRDELSASAERVVENRSLDFSSLDAAVAYVNEQLAPTTTVAPTTTSAAPTSTTLGSQPTTTLDTTAASGP